MKQVGLSGGHSPSVKLWTQGPARQCRPSVARSVQLKVAAVMERPRTELGTQPTNFRFPFSNLAPEPWIHANSSIEEAHTPPSSWYITDEVWQYEKQTVFARNWVAVGHTGKLQNPGDFITGRIAGTAYIIVKGEDGELRAFHNVCRHHAAPVSMKESGNCSQRLSCPYHGWEYDLEGRFRAATQMKGIKGFEANRDASLVPIKLDTWSHWIFLQLDPSLELPPIKEWFGRGGQAMSDAEVESENMVYVRQMTYDLKCNWKVYNDNYLDGCYHCPVAHPGLCSAIDVDKYHSVLYERVNFQIAPLASEESLASVDSSFDNIVSTRVEGDGRGPTYAFCYPNIMINRYSLWTGTILVNPTGPDTCTVYMDYWVDKSKVGDERFIDDVVQGEHIVQEEDVALCDLVQEGIFSPIYDVGRYAPQIEQPMFHFHKLIAADFAASA